MAVVCSAKKCEFGGNIISDSFLSCWLCDNVAHIKCAGGGNFGRLHDLISKRMGLIWSCLACREIEAEMRTFMRQTRTGFWMSGSNLRKIPNIDNSNFLQPIGIGTPSSHLHTSASLDSPSGHAFPEINPFLTPTNNVMPLTVSITADTAVSASSVRMHLADDVPTVPATVPVPPVSTESAFISAPGLTVLTVPATFPLPSIASAAAIVSAPGLQLRAVVPQKAIFVSRLLPETTPEDVKLHLSHYLHTPPDAFVITKFNFKNKRNISSFKIFLPDSLLSKALEPSAWPEHRILHEFLPRSILQTSLVIQVSVLPKK
ncbi:uncharacterized protein LOC121404368 [Drosophila obscura]|uniref:uncharacterized protein LOC121404368 n=1 Tax=Drosophila obscura TaxID=7282 RepID=UPI001BB2C8A9|nr:uncharacterized protein LOC121404368 [Drosophila obscura]